MIAFLGYNNQSFLVFRSSGRADPTLVSINNLLCTLGNTDSSFQGVG